MTSLPCATRFAGVRRVCAAAKHAPRSLHNARDKGTTMKKFLVLYRAPSSSFEQMSKATPEQQKAGMDAWMAWSKRAGGSLVDMGSPLGKSLRVTRTGASAASNDLGGYSVLQGESKEAIAEAMKGHPHFMMPEGFIEIVEMMPIPGM